VFPPYFRLAARTARTAPHAAWPGIQVEAQLLPADLVPRPDVDAEASEPAAAHVLPLRFRMLFRLPLGQAAPWRRLGSAATRPTARTRSPRSSLEEVPRPIASTSTGGGPADTRIFRLWYDQPFSGSTTEPATPTTLAGRVFSLRPATPRPHITAPPAPQGMNNGIQDCCPTRPGNSPAPCPGVTDPARLAGHLPSPSPGNPIGKWFCASPTEPSPICHLEPTPVVPVFARDPARPTGDPCRN